MRLVTTIVLGCAAMALGLPGLSQTVSGIQETRAYSHGIGRITWTLSKDLPTICLEAGLGGAAPGASADEAAAAAARRIRQVGVEHVISGGGRIPWEEGRLKEMMDRLKTNGLTLANLMISETQRFPHFMPGTGTSPRTR